VIKGPSELTVSTAYQSGNRELHMEMPDSLQWHREIVLDETALREVVGDVPEEEKIAPLLG